MFHNKMASHYRWYNRDMPTTVPFNAVYSYPSQSNQAAKSVPRISPKNQQRFTPGNEIQIDLPATGYMNPSKSMLFLDVVLTHTVASNDYSIIRFQNNIQSIFQDFRILYGSSALEEIREYGLLVRLQTEWTATCQFGTMDQTSISEGIGGISFGVTGNTNILLDGASPALGSVHPTMVNTRQAYIQGFSNQKDDVLYLTSTLDDANTEMLVNRHILKGGGYGAVPSFSSSPSDQVWSNGEEVKIPRRYGFQLMSGLFNQGKLIPLKYMASQLQISLVLATADQCMIWKQGQYMSGNDVWATASYSTNPSYYVENVVFIPELLEFDASYDAGFLEGLQKGGIPIKFSSFNTYQFACSGGTSEVLSIPERNISVKSIFCVQQRRPVSITVDSGACFSTSNQSYSSTIQEFQYRVGGRYFPGRPVQCSVTVGGEVPNGGAEAFFELQKALNTVGDYRLSTSVNVNNWQVGRLQRIREADKLTIGSAAELYILPEHDYQHSTVGFSKTGERLVMETEAPKGGSISVATAADKKKHYLGRSTAGSIGSSCFACAVDLETSNGLEFSGLNASEQSNIELMMKWSHAQESGFIFVVYTYYDALLILRENNVVELIK